MPAIHQTSLGLFFLLSLDVRDRMLALQIIVIECVYAYNQKLYKSTFATSEIQTTTRTTNKNNDFISRKQKKRRSQ